MKNKIGYILILIAIGFGFTSCDKLTASSEFERLFEYNYQFKNRVWNMDTIPTYQFEIENPSIPTNVLLNVRNGLDYPFYNIFVKYSLEDSTGKILDSKQLEFDLLDPKSGKPLGKGATDLYFHQFVCLNNFKFPYKGNFKFKITQYMREQELKGIHSVGVRIESLKQ